MPVWSRDIQYGAAAGFIVIVGIVAIQFGFSAKLVLALLAGVGVLFCASMFEGLPRAAMIGASAVLLLLVAYNLATTCDSACQQSRVEATQQRSAQEAANRYVQQNRTTPSDLKYCNSRKSEPFEVGKEPVRINPRGQCAPTLFFSGHCVYAKQANEKQWWPSPICDKGTGDSFPPDTEYVKNAEDDSFTAQVKLDPPRYISLFH